MKGKRVLRRAGAISAASSCTCIAVQAIQKRAAAQEACDVQEQHPSGVQPELERRPASCGSIPSNLFSEGGSKGGILKAVIVPAEQACDPTADTIAKAIDNIGWRTQAVRYGEGILQAQAVPDSLRARSAGLLRILLCSQQLEPFYRIGCSVIHTKKALGFVVVKVDSGNGSLRLCLGLHQLWRVPVDFLIHPKSG